MAVSDARAIERTQHRLEPAVPTQPNHSRWYEPVLDDNGGVRKCEICFAGAIMVQGMSETAAAASHEPSDFEHPWPDVFMAIEAVRRADWEEAAQCMEGARGDGIGDAKSFEELMLDQSDAATIFLSKFVGWEEFTTFLDTMERDVLPAVQRCEGRLYTSWRAKEAAAQAAGQRIAA